MRKIVIWLVPLVLFGVALSLPAVAVAALTPPSTIWQQTITDTTADANSAMDIAFVRHTFEGGFHYFEMELVGPPGGPPAFANSYAIYIKNGAGVSLGSFDYRIGYDQDYALLTAPPPVIPAVEHGQSGVFLRWRTDPFPGDVISFLGLTSKGAGLPGVDGFDITNSASAVVPIPGAAYLLGSGVIGLVGLRRRQAKRS